MTVIDCESLAWKARWPVITHAVASPRRTACGKRISKKDRGWSAPRAGRIHPLHGCRLCLRVVGAAKKVKP